MRTIVAKFGGSSLADADQIRKAAAILRADPARRFVVVSAPGKRCREDTKITDLLYRCYELAAAGADFSEPFGTLQARYDAIVRELGADYDLDAELAAIRAQLLSAPQRDYTASRGEYLNAGILASFLGVPFLDAAQTVRFDADGRLDQAATDALLGAALAGVERAVLPGFYGSMPDGTIRTFSRGGSDVTGSLAARAARADVYENWTDVSGVLFTDPRIFPEAAPIAAMTYRELRELSYMGASVLHEDAVFPVRSAGIPINIRNTNRPDDPGTMILPALNDVQPTGAVTGVAGRRGFTSVFVEKSMMNAEVGFGARLLAIFSEHGISFEHCPTGIDTMSVVVSSAQIAGKETAVADQIRRELRPDALTIEPGLAMIAVVGHGMVSARGVAARIFGALAEAGVNIRMIDQGSSELNIIVGVNETDFEPAIRAISASCR